MNGHRTQESIDEIETLIASSKSLHKLGRATRSLLAESAVRQKLASGEALWSIGDPGSFCALVTAGWVEVFRSAEGATPGSSMGIFGAGDIVGLSTLFRNDPFTDGAVATTDGAETVKFFLAHLLREIDDIRSPELATWVREMFLVHDRILQDKIDVLAAGNVDQKLLTFLRHLIRRFGIAVGKGAFRIPITLSKTQVARIIDVRVETSIRTINAWQQNGWIQWEPKQLIIPNLEIVTRVINPVKAVI